MVAAQRGGTATECAGGLPLAARLGAGRPRARVDGGHRPAAGRRVPAGSWSGGACRRGQSTWCSVFSPRSSTTRSNTGFLLPTLPVDADAEYASANPRARSSSRTWWSTCSTPRVNGRRADRPISESAGARFSLFSVAGPRIGEVIAADRGDFDLAGGRWRIPESKTDSGRRDVEQTMYLRDELVEHVATMEGLGREMGSRQPMFPTRTGGRHGRHGVGDRLAGAVERANAKRAGRESSSCPTE
jgi:hypothetical protein